MKKQKFHNVKRTKYNNQRVEHQGWLFDSKLERDFYQHLQLLMRAGEVTRILRQVPFHLAPGSKLVVDFEVKFSGQEDVKYFDTKGVMTAQARTKIKLAEHLFGVQIEIVKRGEF